MWMVAIAMMAATAAAERAPDRILRVTIRPGGKCPVAAAGEVVVCRTEDEPYRIPKPLRRSTEIAAANGSWVNRAATLDEVGRVAGGLPDTCSPVGTGGQTGCAAASLKAWAADRRVRRRAADVMP